jgi:hypothetical protein
MSIQNIANGLVGDAYARKVQVMVPPMEIFIKILGKTGSLLFRWRLHERFLFAPTNIL